MIDSEHIPHHCTIRGSLVDCARRPHYSKLLTVKHSALLHDLICIVQFKRVNNVQSMKRTYTKSQEWNIYYILFQCTRNVKNVRSTHPVILEYLILCIYIYYPTTQPSTSQKVSPQTELYCSQN